MSKKRTRIDGVDHFDIPESKDVESPRRDPKSEGAKADARVRRNMDNDKQQGDVAGHRRALRFGADPDDGKNVDPMNDRMNGPGGTWYAMEDRLAREKDAKPDQNIAVDVGRVVRDDSKRPRGFIVRETRTEEGKEATVSELRFVNPVTGDRRVPTIKETERDRKRFLKEHAKDPNPVSRDSGNVRDFVSRHEAKTGQRMTPPPKAK